MSDNIAPVDTDVCNVTFDKKEYAIVGDAVFAQSVVGVPAWMQELVGDLVTEANGNAYDAMSGFNLNLYNAMLALQVAENQYTQTINSKITDQEAFIQAVETLNSTVQNAEAEIVGIKQTYATKDFATATAAQTLEASLNGGAIKSSLGQLASAMTNQYGTMAQRMDVLESTFEDLESDVQGYANATSGLETFVGKNAPNTNAPVVTSSKFYQDLDVYLAGTNYTTGGTNTLVNQVTAAVTGVESKFAYNSNLTLNGIAYSSGFGLATSLTPGSNIPVGSSEFWINADKFKLTTTGYNGTKYSPFSVDGANGEITFNGKVSFSSVTNTPSHPSGVKASRPSTPVVGSTYTATDENNTIYTYTDSGWVVNGTPGALTAEDLGSNGTTVIDGGRITTGYISANRIAAGAITADKISADAIDGRYITGGTIEGAFIKGANILGAVIKSSWLDFSESGYLTDWKSLTPANVPAAYIDNFAKNNDGSLVPDSEGFARLPTTGTIGDVHVPNSTISRASDEGPNGETNWLPAIFAYAVAYDDYTTSNSNRFLRERITVGGGSLLTAQLRGGIGSYDYVTLNTTIKVGYYSYQISAQIDDYDRWWLTVSRAYSSTNSFNNYGNIVNWSGTGNVATRTYTDPNNCFNVATQSYGDIVNNSYSGVATLDIVVSMPPGFIEHNRLSGPLVSIGSTTLYRSDNDPSFTVTRGIPKISYVSGLLQAN